MPDTLKSVLRIRRMTLDSARRELTAILHMEETARLHADEAAALIEKEGESAAEISFDDQAVEAFAAWLPIGRANAVAAREKHEQLRSEVAKARAAVTLARAAAETAQNLLDQRNAERVTEMDRRAQVVLDDFAAGSAVD